MKHLSVLLVSAFSLEAYAQDVIIVACQRPLAIFRNMNEFSLDLDHEYVIDNCLRK